jgi:hypothetical protein
MAASNWDGKAIRPLRAGIDDQSGLGSGGRGCGDLDRGERWAPGWSYFYGDFDSCLLCVSVYVHLGFLAGGCPDEAADLVQGLASGCCSCCDSRRVDALQLDRYGLDRP